MKEEIMVAETAQPRGLISRLTGVIIMLVVMLMIVTAAVWIACRPATPDAFYSHQLPQDARVGTLLKSEPFSKAVPEGAQGWRILYVTTRVGKPVVASAVIVVAKQNAQSPRPIIAWAHGTTGVVSGCAPSVMEKPFDNLPSIDALVREGWAYIGADYPGLGTDGGHTYLVGEDAANAVLDAVRAARQMRDANLGDRLVVWGHSQGGNSALWAGMRVTEYAPELKLLGVAALAPASDLKGLVSASKGGRFGKIISALILRSYSQAYPDVQVGDYARGVSRLIASDIASRCVGGYGALFSVLETNLFPSEGIFSRDPTTGSLGNRLGENTPTGIIPAPVLIAQGEVDDLVLPEVQKRYVTARCSAGQKIGFRTYAGRSHLSLVGADSPLAPELLSWTRDLFDGKPKEGNCKP
ncbi:alpha/beta fold hydrolase [Bradyrhizobium embrapense]|uniref:alpha/beta fold hydrolase n=1 Tax=Bradyrhizobium embrapense TaxID=630921 RepID=UPI00067C212D|nr:alpha/beta fold hydrolase [Bradyrhizobium embrapense]